MESGRSHDPFSNRSHLAETRIPTSSRLQLSLSVKGGDVKNRALFTPGTAGMKNNEMLERMSPE